ncbi:hypothetical protein FE783_23840 [Paenibacillus mesophilus]|nr:hypothetical protein FE783_23840 [Paenibacillus mesophilus]
MRSNDAANRRSNQLPRHPIGKRRTAIQRLLNRTSPQQRKQPPMSSDMLTAVSASYDGSHRLAYTNDRSTMTSKIYRTSTSTLQEIFGMEPAPFLVRYSV